VRQKTYIKRVKAGKTQLNSYTQSCPHRDELCAMHSALWFGEDLVSISVSAWTPGQMGRPAGVQEGRTGTGDYFIALETWPGKTICDLTGTNARYCV